MKTDSLLNEDWSSVVTRLGEAASLDQTARATRAFLRPSTAASNLDRIPVVKGEIRIRDRVYMQPARIANVLAQGADVVIRAGWRSVRWLDAFGKPIDLHKELRNAGERIDRP